MGVDAALGRDTQALCQLHLAAGGEIEEAALGDHRLHHGRVRHGLQRVVQIDARQRLLQLAVLHAHALAVEDQERRAELPDEAADFGGLKRIDESRARHLALGAYGSTAIVPVPSSLSATLVAARSSRSRIASQRSPSGTACTRMRWQPALSRVRRLA